MRSIVATALLLALGANAQPFRPSGGRSPFNGREVGATVGTGRYRILIGGHFHGESTNHSGYPARTLLASIDTINATGADVLLSTGDLFMDTEADRGRYARTLFSRLRMPMFNAVGNHDLDGRRYVDHYGPTSMSLLLPCDTAATVPLTGTGPKASADVSPLTLPHAYVVILDTEEDGGSILGAQLQRLIEADDHVRSGMARAVFIVSHRPIWAEDDERYAPLFRGNTRSLTGTNFKTDVYPLLKKMAERAPVYWISGSMGGTAPSSIFFQPEERNITYVQCAIRDEARDALLIADVYPDTVKWTGLSLTGQRLLPVEQYDAAWWRAHQGEQQRFNWKLLPYLIKITVTHRAFWWGAGAALVFAWAVRRLLRCFL